MNWMQEKLRDIWAALNEPRIVYSILILYCAAHFLIRLLLSPNFSLDESEQMLFSQSLQWGYRFRHPPLITWLSWATLAGTGNSRAAFFLLKYVVMGLGLAAFFAMGRIVIRDTRLAALATFALLTTFVMGFLPQVDLMHTVLLATLLAAYMWADACVIAEGKTRDYLLLGVITGLGILSKYFFVVLPIAMTIGVALTPRFRARLKIVPLLGALIIAALIVTPYVWWASAHEYSLFTLAQTITKSSGPSLSPLHWLEGAGDLVVALAGFVVPMIVLFPLLYWPACKPLPDNAGDADDRDWLRVYGIAMIAATLLMLCAVFFIGMEEFKPRWMHQVLMPLPIWFFLRVKLAGASERNNKIFAAVAAVFALAVIVARPAIYFTDAAYCKQCREYWPMRNYATALQRSGFYHGTILASTYDLGGSLRYVLPDARVVTPGYPASVFGEAKGGECLIIWRGRGEAPKAEMDYAAAVMGAAVGADAVRGDVMAPLVTASKRLEALGYILLPAGSGACN